MAAVLVRWFVVAVVLVLVALKLRRRLALVECG